MKLILAALLCITALSGCNMAEKAAEECVIVWMSDENINLKNMPTEYMSKCCEMVNKFETNMDSADVTTCVHKLIIMKQIKSEVNEKGYTSELGLEK